MIGAFNRSGSVAKRRSQPFVPRFDYKYSELQTESWVFPQNVLTPKSCKTKKKPEQDQLNNSRS